jgi:HAD superfamily hydrolase (TIGR01450 family)
VDYIKKLEKMGIAATKEDFMTSSQATAFYLKKHHWGKTLYVCGTESLKQELMSEGFVVSDDITKTECIVMGFDTELTFQKLHDVSYLLLTQPNLPYIATNPDLVCPTEFGSVPDCGSVCGMIRNATGLEPIVIGKPTALMPQLAMEKWGVAGSQTCVIGDRIYTDIKSGLNAGTLTVLVLSGETTKEILEASDEKPHLVLSDAGKIRDALKNL